MGIMLHKTWCISPPIPTNITTATIAIAAGKTSQMLMSISAISARSYLDNSVSNLD